MRTGKAPRQPRGPRGPFARPFDVRSLKGEARRIDLKATPEECAVVAAAVSLPGIAALSASFRVVPRAGDRIELDGRVVATVTQTCVVSLEPFETAIEQHVAMVFAPAAEAVPAPRGRGGRGEPEMMLPTSVGGNDDQEDPPDLIVDDMIDLGAVAVEFMVLGLDAYPHKPGVHFDDMVVGENDAPAPSAFAALARLKDRS